MSDIARDPNFEKFRFTIERLPKGGFVVISGGGDYGFRLPLLATSGIDEALAFMKEHLLVEPAPTPNTSSRSE